MHALIFVPSQPSQHVSTEAANHSIDGANRGLVDPGLSIRGEPLQVMIGY